MPYFKCKFCGWECSDPVKFQETVNDHLSKVHETNYWSYYEYIKNYNTDPLMCWKCGNERQQMTTWSNNYPLPCWDCVGTSKADIQAAQKVVLDYYREIHEKASKDKFFQYFLTVSDEERGRFLVQTYDELEKIFTDVLKRDKVKLGKESFFNFQANPWSLKEISERNKNNLHFSLIPGAPEKEYIKKKQESWDLTLSDGRVVELRPTEAVEYDVRHHSRYSMLNLNAKRQTRKLRIGDAPPWNRCIKFCNTEFTNIKSIIGINWKGTEKIVKNISLRSLPEKDIFLIKQFIVKNKELWGCVLEIIMEMMKYVNTIEDHVFAHKTVYLGPNKGTSMILHWFPLEYASKGKLNISIL